MFLHLDEVGCLVPDVGGEVLSVEEVLDGEAGVLEQLPDAFGVEGLHYVRLNIEVILGNS